MVREPIIFQIFRGPSANVRNLSAVPVATRTVLEPDQRLGPRSANAKRGGAIFGEGESRSLSASYSCDLRSIGPSTIGSSHAGLRSVEPKGHRISDLLGACVLLGPLNLCMAGHGVKLGWRDQLLRI